MTELETYKEHIQYSHNTFSKIVIDHAAIDEALRVHKRWQREISQ